MLACIYIITIMPQWKFRLNYLKSKHFRAATFLFHNDGVLVYDICFALQFLKSVSTRDAFCSHAEHISNVILTVATTCILRIHRD